MAKEMLSSGPGPAGLDVSAILCIGAATQRAPGKGWLAHSEVDYIWGYQALPTGHTMFRAFTVLLIL